MNKWKCEKCGATYKQKLPAKEVGHWCPRNRNQWHAMTEVEQSTEELQ